MGLSDEVFLGISVAVEAVMNINRIGKMKIKSKNMKNLANYLINYYNFFIINFIY